MTRESSIIMRDSDPLVDRAKFLELSARLKSAEDEHVFLTQQLALLSEGDGDPMELQECLHALQNSKKQILSTKEALECLTTQ